MSPDQLEAIQEAIESGRLAVALLTRIQSEEEGDYMPMPWPEIDNLALALDDLEGICK